MQSIQSAVAALIWAYILLLIMRMIIGLIMAFARDWEPRGLVLVVVEGVFTLTDPPLRALRKVIPPLRLGSIQLDLAFLILILLLQLLLQLVLSL